MSMFNQVTQKPYGYLVVDMKPMTQDELRLRQNILEQSCVTTPIKEMENSQYHQLLFDQQTDNITEDMSTQRPVIIDKLSCIDCGTLFASLMGLQRHIKRKCPEADDSDEERPVKREKWITLESDESDQEMTNDENSDKDGDNADMDYEEKGFEQLIQKAYDNYNDLY